jgi:hypothetical protein
MRVEVERTVWSVEKGIEESVYQTIEDVWNVEVSETGVLILTNEDHDFLAAFSPQDWASAYRVPEE